MSPITHILVSMHLVALAWGFWGWRSPCGVPSPKNPSVAGAVCREQPTYAAVLDERCCLIRWDAAGTFCFYCRRKKIVLILISSGSAGSDFSQRKMLEEMLTRRVTPFRSAGRLCLPQRLSKAAGGSGGRVGRGLPLALRSASQLLAPLGSSWESGSRPEVMSGK